MDAIILAAGLGTRLRPHTLTTPKPLLPVRGRPILDWALGALPAAVDRVLVVTHYLGEQIEAYDLLCHVLDVDDVDPDQEVPASARRKFDGMVRRRAAGEPVQLIKGFAVFRGLEVLARPGVFVPRDSTEFLAEQATRTNLEAILRQLHGVPQQLHGGEESGTRGPALLQESEDGEIKINLPKRRPPSFNIAGSSSEPNRNAPCPCGSGKKFKQCCGKEA